ncbi:MAG: hypothetical protein PHU97_00615 [Bacteroidales bacterium]|nr:hypothetical protein [Bacteroidales bacterium]MDD3009805.1 hypothetical protein [Bacteroidales bacterium]MDD3960315.1 hypothetical protein [Bacteroidales bacterium]MDY0284736.1 hypothetical protein [Bacteroidales bacterium]HPE87539.1 hypothetical protein [Bacteroidales bacterium]
MKRITYILVALVGFSLMVASCKTVSETAAEQPEKKSEATTLRDEISGLWKLSGIEEPTQHLSAQEKESYESYLEEILLVYKLELYGDGTYTRVALEFRDRGKWRLVDGDTVIELYSEQPEHSASYYIVTYENPHLVLDEEQNGEKKKYYLQRAD